MGVELCVHQCTCSCRMASQGLCVFLHKESSGRARAPSEKRLGHMGTHHAPSNVPWESPLAAISLASGPNLLRCRNLCSLRRLAVVNSARLLCSRFKTFMHYRTKTALLASKGIILNCFENNDLCIDAFMKVGRLSHNTLLLSIFIAPRFLHYL